MSIAKLDRAKNTVRNIFWGIANKIITLIIPFILRTMLIHTLGAEYLGLNSLFTAILTVLNLAELGFSSAAIFSMYKPIAESKTDTICALMAFYKKTYRYIGIIVTVLGIIILPFLPNLVKGDYPVGVNIYVLFMLFLANTATSYFLFGYKTSIILAHQREDILNKINLSLRTIMYVFQGASLLVWNNYYLFVFFNLVFTVLISFANAYYANRAYPQYVCKGELDDDTIKCIRRSIGGLMIGKVCMVSRNSFDSIFLSMFLGLQTVAIYGNYYYLISAINGFLVVFMTAMSAGIGNSVVTESVQKNYYDLKRLVFIYAWISGWCATCLLCLLQPFMKIWMGEGMLFPFIDVILMCLYFYSLTMGDVRSQYSSASGLFWESRNYVVSEAIINVILNYVLGKIFGVSGIIIATLISIFLINFMWGSRIVFEHYFKSERVSNFYLIHGRYLLVTLFVASLTLFTTSKFVDSGIVSFIVKSIVAFFLPNVLYYLIYSRTKIFSESRDFISRVIGFKAKVLSRNMG